MDKIYEAYYNIVNENKMKDLEVSIKSLAKKLGIKYNPNMLKLSTGKIDWNKEIKSTRNMKPNNMIVGVSSDETDSSKGSVYVIFSVNDKYNGTATIKKYTNNDVSKTINQISKDLTPKPSAKDVNKAQGRFGRM